MAVVLRDPPEEEPQEMRDRSSACRLRLKTFETIV